jgi:hypothetical protein
MSVKTLEESFANFLAVNTKVAESVPTSVLLPDCPICMEVIVTTKNIVVTECGHTFHCSCLMANVAHNGFSCPYCRTAMAEEVDNKSNEYEYDGSITDSVDASIHEDDMLRGFRMFHNLCDGIEHEQVDIDYEKYYEAYLDLNAAAARYALNQNQSNPDQEPEWDTNGNIWDAERDADAAAAAERDAAAAAAERDADAAAERAAESDALIQNHSNPDQETYWDNLASVAADYRAAPSDDEYATYWDNIANTAAEHDADDHYEEYSFSDRYHDDEESLWSDDDDGSEYGFQQNRGIHPNA